MIRRRFWTGALKAELVACALADAVDADMAADELIEACSADEELSSRNSAAGYGLFVMASVEAA